jgi:CBS domain-containing protein
MRIEELYRPEVVAADIDESLGDVASQMQFSEVGSLAIFADHGFIGIITERDLARAIADGVDPQDTLAGEYMTEHPVAVDLDSEVADAVKLMLELGIRHLPVMDGGKIVGMLSARDLLVDVVG